MKRYFLWEDIQNYLTKHFEETGALSDFYSAMCTLWEAGKARTAEELPSLDLDFPNGFDFSKFRESMNKMPIDMDFLAQAQNFDQLVGETKAIRPGKIAAHQKLDLHTQDSYEFLYVMHGKGGIITQDGTVPCGKGALCLIAPGFPHNVYAEPDSEVISICFAADTMEFVLGKLLRKESVMTKFFRVGLHSNDRGYIFFELDPDPTVCTIISRIFAEGYGEQDYSMELCSTYIELLFGYALRCCSQTPYNTNREKRIPGIPLAAIMKYIQENYRTITLAQLAQTFHYDADYLGKQIKQFMGVGYSAMVTQIKVSEAKRLLERTDVSIERIADLAGFGSAVYLSRSFKKETGITPSQYRAQYKLSHR